MTDPSELLPMVTAAAVSIGSAVAFYRARRIASGPLRVSLRSLAGLTCVLTGLVTLALIFFAVRYTRHLPPAVAPDGKHLAITTYTIDNGTGVDQVEVTVRHAWSPYAHSVYTGPSKYDPGAAPEPAVEWESGTELRVRFHTYLDTPSTTGTEQACATEASGIKVICEQTRVHATH